MRVTSVSSLPLCLVVCMGLAAAPAASFAAAPSGPAYADPASTDEDFPFQGEYSGSLVHDGQSQKYGVQVVALGEGKFDLVVYPGGLPGDGWTPPEKTRGTGVREGSGSTARVKVEGVDPTGTKRAGEIRNGVLAVLGDDGNEVARFSRVERKSPTLGATPPAGAIVIVDGAGPVDEKTTLKNPRLTDDGLLMEGVSTEAAVGDAQWHIEFRLPYQPTARGQGRGNSGAYVGGAYEVQMLDSFGLEGKNNECGGIYSVAAPRVNMCLPPLTWQTYDIDFTAPRFEGETKVKNATMTVRHNGVVIHENVEVPKITPGGALRKEQPTGPLHLQNHGNPVRYRNIWVKPKS